MTHDWVRSRPVIALAGRRIDAPGAPERFPLQRVGAVREALRQRLVAISPVALVSSAACGADLLALELAGHLGSRRRIVLPFSKERFRETSVTDRPGDWGTLYDQAIAEVEANDDLVTLENAGTGDDAYTATNLAILDEAERLAAETESGTVVALVVWDGHSRGPDDLTAHFMRQAEERRLLVQELRTD